MAYSTKSGDFLGLGDVALAFKLGEKIATKCFKENIIYMGNFYFRGKIAWFKRNFLRDCSLYSATAI